MTGKIAELNDDLRAKMLRPNPPGRVMLTQGIQALPINIKVEALMAIKRYTSFTDGEHDFITVEFDGRKIFAKIDYYDKSLEYGSEDPADPDKTTRVMTVMLAEEY